MGFYVHLHVCFNASNNDVVASVAKKHHSENREAQWYLDELSKRIGNNFGPKGGLSLWGIVGNYTDPEEFVASLKDFWAELLESDLLGGIGNYEHILVFYEKEQTEYASAYEIFLKDGQLEIKHHEKLPFAWMQF